MPLLFISRDYGKDSEPFTNNFFMGIINAIIIEFFGCAGIVGIAALLTLVFGG